MKKTHLTLILFIFTLVSYAQEVKKKYYDSGKLMKETPFVDGRKHGIEKWYFESGKVRFATSYTHGTINGSEKNILNQAN